MNKSEERAMEILEHYLSKVDCSAKEYVKSVILVGSLTTNSYTGDRGSDIDLVNVLKDDAPENARMLIKELITQTELETDRDIPISRCVYRYRDLFTPYPQDFPLCLDNKDYIELPIEIMRIKDSGKTVWGEELIKGISYPLREDVIQFKRLAREWEKVERARGFTSIPQDQLPIRLIVQSVLVRALLDYYFATGESCSSKAAVAALLRKNVPDYPFVELVECCRRWRYEPDRFTEEDEHLVMREWKRWTESRQGKEVDFVPV